MTSAADPNLMAESIRPAGGPGSCSVHLTSWKNALQSLVSGTSVCR